MSGGYHTRQKGKEEEHALFREMIEAQAKTTEALVKLYKETKKSNTLLAELKVTAESMDETLLDIYEAKEKKRAKLEASQEPPSLRESMMNEAKEVVFSLEHEARGEA